MRIINTVIIITVYILVSCGGNKKKLPGADPVKEFAVTILKADTVTVHRNFPAIMEGQQVIEIRPMINGYISKIFVNEGDHVKEGQLLFSIRNPMYEQEVITNKASIKRAEADVNTAGMEIEKIRPLVEKQIVSDYRLKTAQLELESKEAALAQARAALSNAESNLAYTNIRSPMNGIIGTIPYKTGALVGSNNAQALTTLSNIDSVYAYFSWNEKQLLDFLSHAPGLTIEEKVRNMPPARLFLADASGYPMKGRIELASGLITTETGSATLKAIFPNPSGLIRSGSSGTISIPEVIDSAFVIPQTVAWEVQNKYFAYVVKDSNKISAVPINPVPGDDGKSFLVTSGFHSGDMIVTEGINTLKNGEVIQPRLAGKTNIRQE